MVIITKEVKEKLDKEMEKIPQELVEKIAKTIHKHY